MFRALHAPFHACELRCAGGETKLRACKRPVIEEQEGGEIVVDDSTSSHFARAAAATLLR